MNTPAPIYETINDQRQANRMTIEHELAIQTALSSAIDLAFRMTIIQEVRDHIHEVMDGLRKEHAAWIRKWKKAPLTSLLIQRLNLVTSALCGLIAWIDRETKTSITLPNGGKNFERKIVKDILSEIAPPPSRYADVVSLVKEIRTDKALKFRSIGAVIDYIRATIRPSSPYYKRAMDARALMATLAKHEINGIDKAWRSIRKMSQPSYGKHKRKSFGKMLVPILDKGAARFLNGNEDIKLFDPDKDKLGVEPCAPIGKLKRRRKAR